MHIADLGKLAGDVLVFGGPCSNRQATDALIAAARGHGIGPGNAICTGDIVAYCGSPAETVAAVRGFGCAVLAGNCERQLAAGALDCACGFAEGSVCDRLSTAWFAHADAAIGAEARAWMAGLPDWITFAHAGRRCVALHGGASDIARYVWPSSDEALFTAEIARITAEVGPVDMVLAGHSGIAFAREVAGVTWVNAGAIGLPPHDGRAETRYAVLGERGVVFHRLAYDVAGAVAAMQAAGLVQGYHRTLRTGIWPSEDVLPVELRR